MDITNFRSQMTGDGARPNLFRVQINLPPALQNLNNGGRFAEKLSFTARVAQLPGSTLGKVPTQYMGREAFFAGNRTFADWTIQVLNDEDFVVRRVMETWSAAINTHGSNVRRTDLLGPNSYTADCFVEQLGKQGDDVVIAKYQMISAFPIDISPIDLDWGQNDVIEEFSVTFSMDAWFSIYENGEGIQE